MGIKNNGFAFAMIQKMCKTPTSMLHLSRLCFFFSSFEFRLVVRSVGVFSLASDERSHCKSENCTLAYWIDVSTERLPHIFTPEIEITGWFWLPMGLRLCPLATLWHIQTHSIQFSKINEIIYEKEFAVDVLFFRSISFIAHLCESFIC